MASILADTNQKGGAIPAARFISALIAFKLIFDSEIIAAAPLLLRALVSLPLGPCLPAR